MLGDNLKKLRLSKDLTQKQVADLLKINRVTYTQYEINRREPDNATLIRLADFFEVTVDDLLGRKDKQLTPKNGIITLHDIQRSNITNDEIEIIQLTRKEGLSVEDIQHLAEVIKRHKIKKR